MPVEGPADRFRDLIRRRLLPGLAEIGFDSTPGVLASKPADGVHWLLDIELAPWTTPERICFAAAWGVYVPGLSAAMGEPEPLLPGLGDCPVQELLARDDEAPTWFELRARPWPLSFAQDVATANSFLGAVVGTALPRLRELTSVAEVQAHIYEGLVSAPVPGPDELVSIARVAALSHLLGDRDNALRWLEHLRDRSVLSMSPELVESRIAPLRHIVLAS